MGITRKISCFLFLAFLFSCGVKKPPEPDESVYPRAIKDLEMVVREGCAYLEWEYPGEKLPARYLIFRKEQSQEQKIKIKPVGEVGGKEKKFIDCGLVPGKIYAYSIIAVSNLGFKGEVGQWRWLNYPSSPSPAKNFQAQPGDHFVDLSWEAEEGRVYNLYRSLDPESFPSQPVNPYPIKNFHYPDLNLKNNQTYYYCLRTVIEIKNNPRIESECALAQATPMDLIPPAPPRGLSVVLTEKGVELRWFKSPEPDLLGYLVFRRRKGAKTWQQITPAPIPENYFLDKSAKNLSGFWEYAISALDNSPKKNQSPLSPAQEIFIP